MQRPSGLIEEASRVPRRLSQALLEKETLMREEALLLLTDVEPESRASEDRRHASRRGSSPGRGLDLSG